MSKERAKIDYLVGCHPAEREPVPFGLGIIPIEREVQPSCVGDRADRAALWRSERSMTRVRQAATRRVG
jgi:hypothetical protein